MTPWAPQTRFLDDCLVMEQILRPEKEETKNGKLRDVKPSERLNLHLFSSLTHNSVPVTEQQSDPIIADVSMNSASKGRGQDTHVDIIWQTYVREMSPIYFNLLSEYLEATIACQVDFEIEDVHILKDLADLFAVSYQEMEARPVK